jgi:hypothetical protein
MRIEFFKQLERGEISFERDIIFDLLFELTLAQQRSPKGFPTIAPSATGGRFVIDDNPNGVPLGNVVCRSPEEMIHTTRQVASKFSTRKGNSFGVGDDASFYADLGPTRKSRSPKGFPTIAPSANWG